MAVFFCFSFVLMGVYAVFVSPFLVVSTSAINCLGRLVCEMTYYECSGMLNPYTDSLV